MEKSNLPLLLKKDPCFVPCFHGIIKDIVALGFDEEIKWYRSNEGLEINTTTVQSELPVVFKIILE